MASLPNGRQAILDVRKIEEYCLSPSHSRGRHKARLFREALGVLQIDAQWLRDVLLRSAAELEAVELETDAFGTRWRVDAEVARHDRSVMVRTVWIVRSGEDVPRFVTCWVL